MDGALYCWDTLTVVTLQVYTEIVLTAFFALDYLIHLYLAQSRCHYITSSHAMIDLVAILPVITLFFPDAKIGIHIIHIC